MIGGHRVGNLLENGRLARPGRGDNQAAGALAAVSYTHLTLPTSDLV